MPLPQLHRVRWAVRATLALGVAASVVANVLHARPNPISQTIAAWPPLALLLTVELISRVPVLSRWLAITRIGATTAIAGIAAWVSYWHMAGVASRYGETGASPYLLPLSVDGLIVVASICLVELGGRITAAQNAREAEQAAARPGRAARAAGGARANTGGTGGTGGTKASAAGAEGGDTGRPAARKATKAAKPARAPQATGATGRAATAGTSGPGDPAGGNGNGRPAAPPRPRRSVAETAALAAEIEASRPEASDADVASELGISTARLRAVRRQARDLEPVG